LIFVVALLGLVLAVVSAYVFGQQPSALPPAFNPAANPYAKGIYSEGIVESAQPQGVNINIYPEVAGPVSQVLVSEGESVHRGQVLVTIDDTVQRPATEQQRAQIDVAVAQIANARATLKSAVDTLSKRQQAYAMEPGAVSRDILDTSKNAVAIAETGLRVSERQSVEQTKAYAAAAALLAKFTIRAPIDGIVLSLAAATGSYVSQQGVYNSYTQSMTPLVVIGNRFSQLQVRSYVDEILIPRLQGARQISAEMFIRGSEVRIPLSFLRIQPYVSPKIELSDQRQELVDVRVLPVIFRFQKPANVNVYPGQLVDVYINTDEGRTR
jgi:HlyD family secretion protein